MLASLLLSIVRPSDVPVGFKKTFEKAELTFLHQICYNPRAEEMVPLYPYPDDLTASDIPYAGEMAVDSVAQALANGELDPTTLEKIEPVPFSFQTTRKLNDLAGNKFSRHGRGGGGGAGGGGRYGASQSWDNTPQGPRRSTAKSKRKLEASSPGIIGAPRGPPPREVAPRGPPPRGGGRRYLLILTCAQY